MSKYIVDIHGEIEGDFEIIGKYVEPKTGYLSIDDVMSVFDDFMRGDVDEADTETFLEMLKDRAESEVQDV